jgi:type IV pilus assembly protein PilN
MIRVNLLAVERPTARRKAAPAAAPGALQAILILGFFVTGAVVACALLYLWESSKIAKLNADIAAAEQRQRELQVIKLQVDALEAKRATYQRKVDLIERLRAEQSAPVHMLDEISKALPDFVWLTGMDQAGATVKFTGQSNGLTSVADFISALQRTGYFPQVDLVSSTESNNVVTFTLQATFKSPEVAAKEAEIAARTPKAPTPPKKP